MSPIYILKKWLSLAKENNIPKSNAMCLSTVDEYGYPSGRMILIDDVLDMGVTFYTDQRSKKISDINTNNRVAGTLYWHQISRQIRLEGNVQKLDEKFANRNFNKKTRDQQIMILSFEQSSELSHFHLLQLEFENRRQASINEKLIRPPYWQGYLLKITGIEFFLGKDSRLNKRIKFHLSNETEWRYQKLAP